jgi:hypothetical protein
VKGCETLENEGNKSREWVVDFSLHYFFVGCGC